MSTPRFIAIAKVVSILGFLVLLTSTYYLRMEVLILLYWVIGVDETSLEARGYVLDGDRIVQARCV